MMKKERYFKNRKAFKTPFQSYEAESCTYTAAIWGGIFGFPEREFYLYYDHPTDHRFREFFYEYKEPKTKFELSLERGQEVSLTYISPIKGIITEIVVSNNSVRFTIEEK